MSKNMGSFLIGLLLVVVGAGLYFGAPGIETPVVTLSKVGLVLMIIGGLEALYFLGRMVLRPERSQK